MVTGRTTPVRTRGIIVATAATAATLAAAACGSSSQTVTAPAAQRCSVQIQAERVAFPPDGGTGSIDIRTNRECGWSARSDAGWLIVASPGEGQGEGSIRFTVASNGDPSRRSAGLTVNDQRIEIGQDGTPCAFDVSPGQTTVEAAGGVRTIHVTASSQACIWTAATPNEWITITGGSQGRGNGEVALRVAAVTGPPRAGTVTVAGHTVHVEQGTGCMVTLAASALSVGAAGGPFKVSVTSQAGCGWTVESQSSWITVRSGAIGAGPGDVELIASANTGPERDGRLTIGGRPIVVSQASGCTFNVSPGSLTLGGSGGDVSFSIGTASGCRWSATTAASWLTASATAGQGPAVVRFTAGPNQGIARSGTATVAGQTVAIAQASLCTFELSPPHLTHDSGGGNGAVLVIVSGPCSWNARSAVDWITLVSGSSGLGNGLVQFTIAPNSGPARSAALAIAGQDFLVTQGGR